MSSLRHDMFLTSASTSALTLDLKSMRREVVALWCTAIMSHFVTWFIECRSGRGGQCPSATLHTVRQGPSPPTRAHFPIGLLLIPVTYGHSSTANVVRLCPFAWTRQRMRALKSLHEPLSSANWLSLLWCAQIYSVYSFRFTKITVQLIHFECLFEQFTALVRFYMLFVSET